jgi:hypothetical protein
LDRSFTDKVLGKSIDRPALQEMLAYVRDGAADRIIIGLNSNRFEIYFPTWFVLIMKFLRILPYNIKLYLTQRILK